MIIERVMLTSGTSDQGTVSRSRWDADGGLPPDAAPIDETTYFPGLDTSKAHLQYVADFPPEVPSFITLVTNNDASACIVVDYFEATFSQDSGIWQPKALFGTIAEEGSADDLFVWMCSSRNGLFVMDSPLKLSPGKNLIAYNVKGPGQRKAFAPCFFQVSYHLVQA